MGSRIDQDLKGVAFLDPDWEATSIDSTASTFTENSPRPGSSTTQDTLARAEMQILGAQARDITFIGTRAGGFPGVGPAGGAVAYYLSGEAVADARHYRPPIAITDLYVQGQTAQSTGTTCVAFPLSGKVLIGFVDDTTASALRLWDPDGNAWSSPGTAPSARGAMVVIPKTERVLWMDEHAGTMYYSDNHGATWTEYARFDTLIETTGGSYTYDGESRYLALDGQGQMLWCGKRTGSDLIRLYTSSDLGLTWTFSVEFAAKRASISTHPAGTIALTYVDSSDDIQFVMMGSADDNPSLAEAVEILTNTDAVEIAVVVDEDGAIWHYAYGDRGGLYNECEYRVSWDNGATWQAPTNDQAVITRDMVDASGSAPQGLSACASMGKVFLAHGSTDSGGIINEHHDTVLVLGGWQGPMYDVTLKTVSGSVVDPARDPVTRYATGSIANTVRGLMWLATHPNPGGAQWSAVSTGSGGSETYTGTTGGIMQVVAATSTYYRNQQFTLTAGGSVVNDCLLRYCMKVIEDQGTTDLQVQVLADTNSFAIRHTDSTFEVYDIDAASVVGSAVTVPANERLRMEVHLDESSSVVTVLWQSMEDSDDPHATKMNKSTFTLTGSHASTGTLDANWGRMVAGGGEVKWEWWYFSASTRYQPNVQRPVELQEGRDGWGRAMDGQYAVAVPDAYDSATDRVGRAVMRGGPVMKAETYSHDTAPDYPIEAVFPTSHPSPFTTWRSIDKSATVNLASNLNTRDSLVAGAQTWLFLLHRANFRRLRVDGKPAGGSFSTLGTIDLATGFTSCTFARAGRVLRPGGGGGRYLHAGELRGGHVIIDPAGTPKLRKIAYNTPGFWNGTAGVTQARIMLDGIDDTEPTSGTVHICAPSGVMAIHRTASAPEIADIRFTIDHSADDAPETYYEIGAVAPFGLHPTGKRWSDGWEWDKTPNVQVNTDSARTERRSELGPTQRSLVLDWSDGFTMGKFRGSAPKTDYVADSTADFPLATMDDVWSTIWEWMELSASFSRQVLWCGKVPGDGVTLTDPTLWLYGYMLPQGVRAQQATGDEGINEFMRASGIQIVEGV